MAFDIQKVDFYNLTVEGHVGEGTKMLSAFAGVGVDLLAFKAVPLEPKRTLFTLIPENGSKMNDGAKKAGLDLDGPHTALLVQGDEKPGALSGIYEKLAQVNIPVSESTGIAHINGGYGVVLYVEPEDCEKALAALQA